MRFVAELRIMTYHLELVIGLRAVAEGQDVVSNVAETVGSECDQYPPRKLFHRIMECELKICKGLVKSCVRTM